MHLNFHEPICFKRGMVYKYYWTVHVDASLSDLGLYSRTQWYEKAKTSAAVTSQSAQLIWVE